MKRKFYATLTLIFLCIGCAKDALPEKNNFDPPELDKGAHVFTITGVMVGSSGNYKFTVNEKWATLEMTFDGERYQAYFVTPSDLKNTLGLSNDVMSFAAKLDGDGNPEVNIVIPSHNKEIATTATIASVGTSSGGSNSYLPKVDSNMANYEGTIKSKLSTNNGKSFSDAIYQSSTYNVTLNHGKVKGFMKCNTCVDDAIYNVSGSIISTNDTHLSLEINSISNRKTGAETLSQPIIEKYEKHAGGLFLKLVDEKKIGIDSILQNDKQLKFIQ